jgi:hypothetical protein
MRTFTAALACTAVCATLAAPARAQSLLEEPRSRQGYYASLGLALAVDHNWQDGESQGTLAAQLFSLRLGQLLTRRFGLGLLIDGGGGRKDSRRATMFALGLEAQWELARDIAVHGAAGLAAVGVKDESDPDAKLEGPAGAGYTAWLSYDWFLGTRRSGGWALTPVAGARLVPSGGDVALVGLIGLQLTYWTGLRREQLLLPPNEAW